MRQYTVYMLASRTNGVLYTGVTGDLLKRVYEHREGLVPGFTKKYGVGRLVYFEAFRQAVPAIEHEKRLKRWRRAWKIELIEKNNPRWLDLFELLSP